MEKFCKDCYFYNRALSAAESAQRSSSNWSTEHTCQFEKIISRKRDLVTGGFVFIFNESCYKERDNSDSCGPSGKNWYNVENK